uniref:C2H2-type domain-containing protein n=1 Tax=Scophthalmus maximus TaxID=52904 RepID=A0A8D3CQT3_SCOMX
MQCEHHITAPVVKKQSVKKAKAKNPQKRKELNTEKKKVEGVSDKKRKRKQKNGAGKKRERKQKRDNLENKERRRRKEPAGEDKRFLSMRAENKIFTEEETKCLTCEKVFEHPNQLKTHRKLHGFRYHCGQCEKGFTTGITRHMQMHRGEKNYLCTTCGKSFLSSGELLLHNRSHTGELPYTCPRCGKGFSSKSHLNVHTRSHTGERPYLCTECPKRFLTLNCLKRHTLNLKTLHKHVGELKRRLWAKREKL